ncbi:hypothetical protein DERF_015753 [Dermatophagoides farinae]|uniref:Uncharacterized protein n=1 Tax=Dermatophagoides farinae TaxID=6954 RepID=A0A922HF14_DERFA|nr:hypothetical protein DERF_015753 [Dermatophagoides farinae]
MLLSMNYVNNILITTYRWCWPNTRQYFKQIDPFINGIIEQNEQIIRYHKYFLIYLLSSSIRFLLLYILPLSKHYRIIIFDLSQFLRLTAEGNLIFMVVLFTMVYMYRYFFLPNNCRLNSTIVDIILEKRKDFIIKSKSVSPLAMDWSNYLQNKMRIHVIRRNFEICMSVSLILYSQHYITTQVQMNWSEFFNPAYTPLFGIIKIVITEIVALMALIDSLLVFNMIELLFTFMLCFYWLISCEYDRIANRIEYEPLEMISHRLLGKFLRQNIQLFIFADHVFRSYSAIFWPI